MSARATGGSISNGTSQQVPADAARPKGCPSNARLRPEWRVRLHLLEPSSLASAGQVNLAVSAKEESSGSTGISEAAAATARAVAAARAVVIRNRRHPRA